MKLGIVLREIFSGGPMAVELWLQYLAYEIRVYLGFIDGFLCHAFFQVKLLQVRAWGCIQRHGIVSCGDLNNLSFINPV